MLPPLCLPIGVTYNDFDAAVAAGIVKLRIADVVERECPKAEADAKQAEVERRTASEHARLTKERDMCSICMTPLSQDAFTDQLEGFESQFHLQQVDRLSCNHYFHTNCICNLIARDRTNAKCPICREPIVMYGEDWNSLNESRPGFLDADAQPIAEEHAQPIAEEDDEEEEEEEDEVELDEEAQNQWIDSFNALAPTLQEQLGSRLIFLMCDLIDRGGPHAVWAVVRSIVNVTADSTVTIQIRPWAVDVVDRERFSWAWPEQRPNNVTWLDLLLLMASDYYTLVFGAHEMNDLNRAMGEVFKTIGRQDDAEDTRDALVNVGWQMIQFLRQMAVQVNGVRGILEHGPGAWSGVLVVNAVGKYLTRTSLKLFLKYANDPSSELRSLTMDDRTTALTYFFAARERQELDLRAARANDNAVDVGAQIAHVLVVEAVLNTGEVTDAMRGAAFTVLLGGVHKLDYESDRIAASRIVDRVLRMFPQHEPSQAENFLMTITMRAPRMLEVLLGSPPRFDGWNIGLQEVINLVEFAMQLDLDERGRDRVAPMRTMLALRFEPYFRARGGVDWDERVTNYFGRASVSRTSPVGQFLFDYLAHRRLGQHALLYVLRRADRARGMANYIAGVLEYAHGHVDDGVMREVLKLRQHDPPIADLVLQAFGEHPEWHHPEWNVSEWNLARALPRAQSSGAGPREPDPKRTRT